MDSRRLAECLLQKKMRWKESISAAENKISELDSIIQGCPAAGIPQKCLR